MNNKPNVSRYINICILMTLLIISACSDEENPSKPGPTLDQTPPAAITDLSALNPTDTSVTLSWTAPGDDGGSGTAAQYDMRFSTSMIFDTNWTSASGIAGVPPPKEAGSEEIFRMIGLSPGTTCYFAIKAADEIPNWSALSNVDSCTTQTPIDDISPAAINDLAAIDSTVNSMTLQWTATGDDGGIGTATKYDIRYSTVAINDDNWISALQAFDVPPPQEAGNTELFTVKYLAPYTDYFFALKAADEENNWSAISNVVDAGTNRAYAWSPIGSGMDGIVRALTVYNGGLVAGGDFVNAGSAPANHIASWDGSSWSPLGSGITGYAFPAFFTLTVYDGKLMAGGNFTTAGGVLINGIAAWDGGSWSALGSGLGVGGAAFDLTIYNSRLIVGGGFTTAGGVTVNGIAAWDGGSWSALDTGVWGEHNRWVSALAVYDGDLIAGGAFSHAGGVPADNIAAWDGGSWSALGSGVSGGSFPFIIALTVFDGKLIVGGGFIIAGGIPTNYIAAWDGSSWSALGTGMNGEVVALTVFDNQLIAGGNFSEAGGVPADGVAVWNGNFWSPLGLGVEGVVWSLAVYGDRLVAGGDFVNAGGISAGYIAAWADH